MGQFRVLILVSLAIMTINSCNGQRIKSYNIIDSMVVNDEILLSEAQFKIVFIDSNTIDIEVIDTNLLKIIKGLISPILKISLNNEVVTAKGNNLLSSSYPDSCDYFYPLNDKKKIILFNNQIKFRKVIIPN